MGCGPSVNYDRSQFYRQKELLDSGSVGEVYLAEDLRTNELVAIKFIPRHKVNNHVEREVLNFSRCQHAQIISFREVFLTDTHLAICMEFAEAGNLLNHLNVKGSLEENEARWLFQQMIAAVDHCHFLDIVLRDIKPENTLLVAIPGKSKQLLKLCDFGTSKTEVDGSLTKTSVGTPIYSAPEVLNLTSDYDGKKADVWSTGVILYCMIYNKHPFVNAEEAAQGQYNAAYKRVMECQYEVPKQPRVSEDLKDLLQKILVKNPEQRAGIAQIYRHRWFTKRLPPRFFEQMEQSRARITNQPPDDLRKWKKMLDAAQNK